MCRLFLQTLSPDTQVKSKNVRDQNGKGEGGLSKQASLAPSNPQVNRDHNRGLLLASVLGL